SSNCDPSTDYILKLQYFVNTLTVSHIQSMTILLSPCYGPLRNLEKLKLWFTKLISTQYNRNKLSVLRDGTCVWKEKEEIKNKRQRFKCDLRLIREVDALFITFALGITIQFYQTIAK
ncbi:hypothetical protein L9F63_009284, partial [Diploptera punctata]